MPLTATKTRSDDYKIDLQALMDRTLTGQN